MNNVNTFTAEDESQIKKMAMCGKSCSDIARKFHVTKGFIYRWLKENNIKRGECKNTETLYTQRESCSGCGYRGYRGGCDYILITGKCRGCPADGCTQYTPEAEVKRKFKSREADEDVLPIPEDDMTDEELIKYVHEKETV